MDLGSVSDVLARIAHTCADDQGGPGRHAASDQYEVLRTVSAAKGHCFRYESAIGHTSDHLPRLKRGLDNKPSAATPHMHSQALYLIYLRWFRRVGASPTYVRSGTLPERCNAFLRVRAAITLDALHEWGKRSPIAERIAYYQRAGRLVACSNPNLSGRSPIDLVLLSFCLVRRRSNASAFGRCIDVRQIRET